MLESATSPAQTVSNAQIQPLLKSVATLLDGTYSDFEISCEGKSWKVHRAIIGPRSQFFRACFEEFKESTTSIVDLKEIAGGPEILDAAINYLYTAQYISGHSPLLHHVQMCIFADRHNIADLVTRSEEEFSQQVQSVLDGGHAFDRFDYSNAVKLIYTSFPAHGALHTRAEDLAVAKAEILFSGTDEAVEFQERIKSNTQFLINVCRRSAVSKKPQGDTPPAVDLLGPTAPVNLDFSWVDQPSSHRRPRRPRPS